MSSKYASARKSAFSTQHGSCYYCGRSMWQSKPKKFANKHGISDKEARDLKCTAEHLVARCDGGGNSKSNIVVTKNVTRERTL